MIRRSPVPASPVGHLSSSVVTTGPGLRRAKLFIPSAFTPRMRRRALLAAVAGAVGTAGCSAGGDRGTRTVTAAPVPTETPTPAGTAPVAATPCDGPEFGPMTRRVVCSGNAPGTAPVRLRRSAARLDLPAGVSFALTNDSDVPFVTARGAWQLWKAADGEWFVLSGTGGTEPRPLAPGTEHRWQLSLSPRLPPGDVRTVGRRGELAVPALGGGRYAFAVDGWFPEEGSARRTVFQATLDLGGEPLALRPTDNLLNPVVSRGVVRARVRTGCRSCPGARYVLERTPGADPDRRVVPETAVRTGPREPLRDALALAIRYGVERVDLTARSPVSPPFGVADGGYAFEYVPTGRVYRVETRVA